MRAERKCQAALETIIIFGISSLVVLLLTSAGLQSRSTTLDTLRLSQARTTVETITSTADEVWSQGSGASKKIIITIPEEINASESGVFNGRTVRLRVLTTGDFTDVSEVSIANITGLIPTAAGNYEITLTARNDDVLITTYKIISVSTDANTYCNNLIYYTILALDDQGSGIDTQVTIQLIDPNGIVRDEQNKVTINGYANGSLNIPSISLYGYWKVYAFSNETVNFKNVLVVNCNGTGNGTSITIINCTANSTRIKLNELSKLSCRVTGSNFIDTVNFLVSSVNVSAFQELNYYYSTLLNCGAGNEFDYYWSSAWANDSTGYSYYTYSNGLPITVKCDAKNPVINNTLTNKTNLYVNEYVCINTTVTDFNLDSVWAELTSPSNNKINLSLSDTGSCAISPGDGVYGSLIQLTEEGTYTLNSGKANDTFGNIGTNTVNTLIYVSSVCQTYNWTINNKTLFDLGSYNKTFYNTTVAGVVLSLSNTTGAYTSKIFNSHGNATWLSMSWIPGAIYGSSYGNRTEMINDIVVLLHLDETNGTSFTDYSGKGNNATLVGTATLGITGKIDKAVYLNNINRTTANYLTIPHNANLNLNITGGTICVWVNITDKTQYRGGLVHKGENETYYDEEYSLQFYGAVGTALPGFVIRDTNLTEHTALSSIELTSGIWQQVCGMYNETVIKVYINGIERGSTAITGGWTPLSRNGSLQVGAQTRYITQKSGIKGSIDEVIIWRRGLNQTEIKELYNAGIIKLNVTYKACNNSLCTNTTWSNESSSNNYTKINLTGQYFQYKFNFFTENVTLSPLLYNVTVAYRVCDINYNEDNVTCLINDDCLSGYCRQDLFNTSIKYCVADSTSCSEGGTSRLNGYKACLSNLTETYCVTGDWINDTDCLAYQGCNINSTKATYCGWQTLGSTCVSGTGCGTLIPGACNDCTSYYTIYPFNTCQYSSGITYCDKGCGAVCDNNTNYYFNDPGDQCSYGCNNSCVYSSTVTCGDPGDLYGYTCYYGTNGCTSSGCTTSSTNCPDFCINDFDGGTCAITTRTDPTSAQTCYYNRICSVSGCNLSSAGALKSNYCDYCTISGGVTGQYSPALNATCNSACPNSGTRYYSTTVTRADDCDGAGNTNILTETYKTGYTYPSQTTIGSCDNTECTLDCGTGYTGACVSGTCTCTISYTNLTIFYEDYTPSPYYSYNWTRLGTDWNAYNGANCYGGSGDCAHADGTLTEAADWINTTANLINLTGAHNVYVEFRVREDTSFDPGDYFRVWCYNSTAWIKIYEIDMGNWLTDGVWDPKVSLNLTSQCWISNSRFKMTVIGNSNNKDFYTDDFTVLKEVLS